MSDPTKYAIELREARKMIQRLEIENKRIRAVMDELESKFPMKYLTSNRRDHLAVWIYRVLKGI
jgi:hypothetical protein